MECEICGAEGAGYIILVEGAKLSVCQDCSGAGKLLCSPAPPRDESAPARRGKVEMEMVDGFGSIIAGARKKLGLPLEVLAERINEKHSFLDRVEHEKTLPDEKLAHKLERELGIKLLQEASSGTSVNVKDGQGKGMTLGDILEIQQRKKRKE
jgi:putative transcription factor